LDQVIEKAYHAAEVEVRGGWLSVDQAGGCIRGERGGDGTARKHAKFVKDFSNLAVLGQGESAIEPVPSDAHAEYPLAVSEVFHLESVLDGVFEKFDVGANNYQVVQVYVYATEPGLVLMNKETGVDGGGSEVDGTEEFLERLVPAPRSLL
jgi:hypothetical protein